MNTQCRSRRRQFGLVVILLVPGVVPLHVGRFGAEHAVEYEVMISTAEMIGALRDQQAQSDGVEFTLRVDEFSGFGTSETWRGRSHLRDDAGGYDGADAGQLSDDRLQNKYFKMQQELTLVRFRELMYRIEKRITGTCDSLSSSRGATETITNNGAQMRSVVRRAEHESVHITSADLSLQTQFYNYWAGWNVIDASTSYATILSGGCFAGPELLENGRSRWRCLPIPVKPFIEFRIEAMRDASGAPMLVAIEHLVYTPETDVREDSEDARASNLISDCSVAFSVERLGEGNLNQSRGATVVSRYAVNTPDSSFWGVARIECIKVARPRLSESLFLEAPKTQTASIGDERLRIAYRLGSTVVNLDSRILTTHQPIDEEISGRLEWWTANGELAPVTTLGRKANESDP